MPKKKCPFIKKSAATTYKLIPGSKSSANEEEEARREEQLKHGIYYEDNYDYLQHLRVPSHHNDQPQFVNVTTHDPDSDPNKQDSERVIYPYIPQPPPQAYIPELDVDVMAALEGVCDDDDLEDDFCILANGKNINSSSLEVSEEAKDDEDDEEDDEGDNDDEGVGDDDEGGSDDHVVVHEATTNHKMSEDDFQEFYEKFRNDDVDFHNDLEPPDDDTMAKTLSLLTLTSQKKNKFLFQVGACGDGVERVGVTEAEGKEVKELVTLETINKNATIENVTGVPRKSKHQPKTVSINFDKKKKKKEPISQG